MEAGVKKQSSPDERHQPIRSPRPLYLDDPRLDKMLGAILELTAQLHQAKDRVQVLEELLIAKGVVTRHELDYFKPDADFEAKATKAREELLNAVIVRNFLED